MIGETLPVTENIKTTENIEKLQRFVRQNYQVIDIVMNDIDKYLSSMYFDSKRPGSFRVLMVSS